MDIHGSAKDKAELAAAIKRAEELVKDLQAAQTGYRGGCDAEALLQESLAFDNYLRNLDLGCSRPTMEPVPGGYNEFRRTLPYNR